jgi:hypothetical protein
MFGRHPRLAIDAFLGIEPDKTPRRSHANYVADLKMRMDFAYKMATREARRQARRHKRRYDLRVREAKLLPGDQVLVRNVGLKGKCKLADKWGKDVYIVISQPNESIPVFQVQRQHGRGKMKILHRNLLLPITSLPVRDSEADQGTVDQPSAVRAPIPSSPVRIAPTQSDSSAVSSPDGNRQRLDRKQDSRPEGDSPVPRYVIPQRRGLNPDATVFVPKRTQRMRTKPAWLNSKDWVTYM